MLVNITCFCGLLKDITILLFLLSKAITKECDFSKTQKLITCNILVLIPSTM